MDAKESVGRGRLNDTLLARSREETERRGTVNKDTRRRWREDRDAQVATQERSVVGLRARSCLLALNCRRVLQRKIESSGCRRRGMCVCVSVWQCCPSRFLQWSFDETGKLC